eukprot:1160416-Pelagomonas_calceolata.AAC.6
MAKGGTAKRALVWSLLCSMPQFWSCSTLLLLTRKGFGRIAVPAYEGSSAEAQIPDTEPNHLTIGVN